jgi:hypothetical protein
MTEKEIRALLVSAGAQISPEMTLHDINFVLQAHLTALKHLLRERDHGPVKPKDMLDPAEQAVEDFEDHIDAQQQVGLHRASFEVSGPLLKGASRNSMDALRKMLEDRFGLPEGDYVIIAKAEHERLLQAERDLEQLRSRR